MIQDFKPITPYYLLMTLPEEEDLSYLILQPFNPVDRPNMAAFMVAKSGPENYGQIIDYRLPRTAFVDGPAQVGALINQNPEISQQFTLWNQQGSNVIQGNLLVVPIDNSVVYFQPIYLQGSQEGLPEFKRVVVVFNDQIVMRETLAQALAEVFGGDVTANREMSISVVISNSCWSGPIKLSLPQTRRCRVVIWALPAADRRRPPADCPGHGTARRTHRELNLGRRMSDVCVLSRRVWAPLWARAGGGQ